MDRKAQIARPMTCNLLVVNAPSQESSALIPFCPTEAAVSDYALKPSRGNYLKPKDIPMVEKQSLANYLKH